MWEEELGSIRVHHRTISEPAEEGEEWVNIESDSVPDEKDQKSPSPPLPLLSGDTLPPPPPTERKKLPRPESLVLDDEDEETSTQLVLSTWGQPFVGSSPGFSAGARGTIYGLLSAERPFYQGQAASFADKFAKASVHSKPIPLRWDSPDFKILYRFSSVDEYAAMVEDLREGGLRKVKVKGEKLRAVTLQPVRVIGADLKCVMEALFPPPIKDALRPVLMPLLEPIPISRQFIFLPSASPVQSFEDTDYEKKYPAMLITLVANLHSSAEQKIAECLQTPAWEKSDIPLQPSSPEPFTHSVIYFHKKFGSLLPLFTLKPAHGGKVMGGSIRLTLLCGNKFKSMVMFYSLVLDAKPLDAGNYVVFSLMFSASSVLELCLYDSPLVPTHPLETFCLHFFAGNMTVLVATLVRDFSCDIGGLSSGGVWRLNDPCGNNIMIHDRDRLVVTD